MQDVTENLIKDLRRFGAQMLNDCEEALTLTEEQLHAIRFGCYHGWHIARVGSLIPTLSSMLTPHCVFQALINFISYAAY